MRLDDDIGLWFVFAAFMAVAMAEMAWPQRTASAAAGRRWLGNLSLFVLANASRLVPGITAFAAGLSAAGEQYGLLGRLQLPAALRFVVAILVLDLMTYAIHVLAHVIPPFWRLHAVHHSDPELDLTTTIRHHPLEMLPGAVIGSVLAVLAGFSATEYAVYSSLGAFVQLVAHANLRLPSWVEEWGGRVLVTPRFHQLHHSRIAAETDSNYGQLLPLWDRLFGTACCGPRAARGEIDFGLDAFRDPRFQLPHLLLAQPVLSRSSGASDASRAGAAPARP